MKNLTGKAFRTNGTTFTILATEAYPTDRISDRYVELVGFGPGQLVAVPYRGICIPNITQNDGVMRLTKVEVNGQTYDRPKAISTALGVSQPMHPYPLSEVT
ncbi:MAG TPA: hypothetical protein VJB98_00190 [Candidatus Paceibacterota bacterium]